MAKTVKAPVKKVAPKKAGVTPKQKGKLNAGLVAYLAKKKGK
jgi:hypothetical protein